MCQKDSNVEKNPNQQNMPMLPTEEELTSLTPEQRKMYLHIFNVESSEDMLSLIARHNNIDEEKRKARERIR